MRGIANLIPGAGGKVGKIYPEHLGAPGGLIQVGNVWYVDPVNGSDTANGGNSWSNAFATLKKAHDSATDKNYDVIVVAPGGVATGSGTSEAAHWTFSKNLITVVGAPTAVPFSPRSRVLFTTAEDAVTCLTISGSGNVFSDLQIGTFVDNDILVNITGSRNAFYGVHFAGIGDSVNTAGQSTARCLVITGPGGENYFNGCTIGIDTVARSTSNAELELLSSTPRNVFEDCKFITYASNSGHLMVNIPADGIDRFVEFKNCLFHNAIESAATGMTVMMTIGTAPGGTILLTQMTQTFGATDWASSFTAVAVGGPVPTNSTSNFLIGAA